MPHMLIALSGWLYIGPSYIRLIFKRAFWQSSWARASLNLHCLLMCLPKKWVWHPLNFSIQTRFIPIKLYILPLWSMLTHLTLKVPRKMHLKILSAEVVCCKWLPNTAGEYKHGSKHCRPRSDCSFLIWVHTFCHRGFLNISADKKADAFCWDWRFRG